MPTYLAIGDALITRDELIEKAATGEFSNFVRIIQENPDKAILELSTGKAAALDVTTTSDGTTVLTRAGFEPIDLGKPLAIEIRHIYTGQYPTPSFFQKTKD